MPCIYNMAGHPDITLAIKSIGHNQSYYKPILSCRTMYNANGTDLVKYKTIKFNSF